MKRYTLVLVLFTIWNYSFSQTKTSTTIFPNIFLEDKSITWENFPACSTNGEYIAVVYSKYSCCIDSGSELWIIESESGKTKNKIKLYPSEEEKAFTLEQNENIIRKVKKIMNTQSFNSMIYVDFDSFTLDRDTTTYKSSIIIPTTSQLLKSDTFLMPKITLSSSCCDYIYQGKKYEKCAQHPNRLKMWNSIKHNKILIEYGYIPAGDSGCDAGPYYKVINAK